MEEWRDILGYEGLYEVSDQGRVRSLNYGCTGRIQLLKPAMNTQGYLFVILYKDGKRKECTVHRLVAQAFLTNAENLPQVNHIDENKQNNCVSNLEWCTCKYNINHETRTARVAVAKRKPVQQFNKDGVLVAVYPSTCEAERATGVHQGDICRCCKKQRHTAGGFIWQYKNG